MVSAAPAARRNKSFLIAMRSSCDVRSCYIGRWSLPLKGATVGPDCGGTFSAMQDERSAAKTNGVSPAPRPAGDAKRVARGLGDSQTAAIWDRFLEHAKGSENDSASIVRARPAGHADRHSAACDRRRRRALRAGLAGL